MTRRVKAMGPAKGRQRVLKSGLILIGALAVAWATWERSCFLGVSPGDFTPFGRSQLPTTGLQILVGLWPDVWCTLVKHL